MEHAFVAPFIILGLLTIYLLIVLLPTFSFMLALSTQKKIERVVESRRENLIVDYDVESGRLVIENTGNPVTIRYIYLLDNAGVVSDYYGEFYLCGTTITVEDTGSCTPITLDIGRGEVVEIVVPESYRFDVITTSGSRFSGFREVIVG